MQIKTKSGLFIQKPTKAQDALINAGIAADPDAFELPDEWFDKAKPAKDFFPLETFNDEGYQRMANDSACEKDAKEWINALNKDMRPI